MGIDSGAGAGVQVERWEWFIPGWQLSLSQFIALLTKLSGEHRGVYVPSCLPLVKWGTVLPPPAPSSTLQIPTSDCAGDTHCRNM